MNFQACVMIFACMYIHMSPKLGNFTLSIEINLFFQFLLLKWSNELYQCFLAMSATCNMIWIYYDLKGKKPVFENVGDIIVTKVEASGINRHNANANDLCVMNHIYYYSWFLVNAVITALRTQSLVYMLRGYKVLRKKEDDKIKKKKANREKKRKQRRNNKKETNKALAEKRNELYRKNQDLMMVLISINKMQLDSDD